MCLIKGVGVGGGGGGAHVGETAKFGMAIRQYSSELYKMYSSCVLCGHVINFKISAHLHNLYHDYPEFHEIQACFHGKASFEKIT